MMVYKLSNTRQNIFKTRGFWLWFLVGAAIATTVIITGISLTNLVIQEAEAYPFTENSFASFDGKYNKKNGGILFKGIMKYKQDYDIKITGIGQVKEWDYLDTSIPLCKHAFSDDFTILLGNRNDHARLYIIGKICEANWNSTWKTFHGNYVIYDGSISKNTGDLQGKGIIDFVINTDIGKISQGKIAGILTVGSKT